MATRVIQENGLVPFIETRRRFGAIGDSITADGASFAAAYKNWTSWGYLTWLRRYMGQRIDLPMSRVYAVAGTTVGQAVTGQLPTALADKLDACIVFTGTNSIGVETLAAIKAGLQTIYEQLLANGTFVIAIPIRAHKSPSAFTGDNLLQFAAVNNWIRDYWRGHRGGICIDVNPSYVDFSTGNVQAAYLRDGIHDNQVSAAMMGQLIANVLNPLIPAAYEDFTHLGDVYDATKNPAGNLLTNGLAAGTGGNMGAANGATGTVPDGWIGYRGANTGTAAVAFSSVSHSTLTGLKKARMTISGTGDSNNSTLINYAATLANFTAGDQIYAQTTVDIDPGTPAGFIGFVLDLTIRDGGFASLVSASDGFASAANGAFGAGGGSFICRTDPITVPAGAIGYVSAGLTAYHPASGSLTGSVIDVSRLSIRKV